MNGAVLTCITTNFNNMMANIYNDQKLILKNNINYFTARTDINFDITFYCSFYLPFNKYYSLAPPKVY